mgnify:CR=1 FL=1
MMVSGYMVGVRQDSKRLKGNTMKRITGTEQKVLRELATMLPHSQYFAIECRCDGLSKAEVTCDIEWIGKSLCIDLCRRNSDGSFVLAFGAFVGPRGALSDKRGYVFAGQE